MPSDTLFQKLKKTGQQIAGKDSKWLFILLGFSFILNIWGLQWGLPDYRGWAADEITPSYILHGIQTHFSHGWHELYPPLHFYILALAGLPLAILDLLHLLDFNGYMSYTILFFLSRFISVLMGTGIIFMVYLCGKELMSRKSALISALFLALNPSFVYYSKMTNADVPYVFWFSICIYFLIRILKYHHQLRDYLLFVIMAAFAVCTKDQAFALFILMPVPILISLHREKGPDAPLYKTVIDKRIGLTLAVGAFTFFSIHNVIFNYEGFINHFSGFDGAGLDLYREYSNTLSGHLQMLIKAVEHVRFGLGWPFFLLSCGGFVVAFIQMRRRPILASFSVIMVSYYLFLFVPIRYHYVRFFLPIHFLFGFFGGYALNLIMAKGRSLKLIDAGIIAAAVYSFLMAVSVDIAMTFDSRFTAEKWLRDHVKTDEKVAYVGWRQYLPRKGDIPGEYLADATREEINELGAEYIVINERFCKCKSIYTALTEGDLGYRPVFFIHKTPWPTSWLYNQIYHNGRDLISTNLDKINPPIKIFQKIESDAVKSE